METYTKEDCRLMWLKGMSQKMIAELTKIPYGRIIHWSADECWGKDKGAKRQHPCNKGKYVLERDKITIDTMTAENKRLADIALKRILGRGQTKHWIVQAKRMEEQIHESMRRPTFKSNLF